MGDAILGMLSAAAPSFPLPPRLLAEDGQERLIEEDDELWGEDAVFATPNEVRVSGEAENYQLYRLFRFEEAPKLFVKPFILPGSLERSCALEPTQFRATVR